MRVSGAFAAGQTFDKKFLESGMEDALPGGWDPAERLKDMEREGVEAAVLYTTLGLSCSKSKMPRCKKRVFVSTMTGWPSFAAMRQSSLPGWRFIPLFDVERGRQELERCKRLGSKAHDLGLSA